MNHILLFAISYEKGDDVAFKTGIEVLVFSVGVTSGGASYEPPVLGLISSRIYRHS